MSLSFLVPIEVAAERCQKGIVKSLRYREWKADLEFAYPFFDEKTQTWRIAATNASDQPGRMVDISPESIVEIEYDNYTTEIAQKQLLQALIDDLKNRGNSDLPDSD